MKALKTILTVTLMFVTLNLFSQTTKHKTKSKKTVNIKSSEGQGGPEGDIVIAIKDKVYFYNDSKIKTNFYFLKGQQAEYYEISDEGRILGLKSGKILRPAPDRKGYMKCVLQKDGVTKNE